MDEPTTAPTPEPVTPEKPGGFLQDLMDVYFAPREAFERIVESPAWVLPFVGSVLLALAFVGVWIDRMDPAEFTKRQLQEQGRWDTIPAEQRGVALEQAKVLPVLIPVMAVLGNIVFVLITAGVLLFMFRFFYAGEVGFKQALAITAWCFFAVGLITTPMTLTVMGLKDDWNLNPQDVLQANLGLLLDKAETAKPLWALATSLDLFSLWVVFLLTTGFAVAVKKATSSALWGVGIPFVILILVFKVGPAALF